ncbi:beta-galactosidase [Microbacterium aquimaris]|uniref:Beta-galactosidase n=1 Tax=Microbacterium aquimaris TaxID=459816 RepID=A0ABU5N5W0_9MICO|nr:beta-galactosidase [Microbacterium aquimaris]MDZ8161484.1 beta-galactosidase [Microbacterium aquimaris]
MAAPARTFTHDGIAFGGDYNPEQWGPSVWTEDVALMREAGVDLVAINVFGWARIEPRPGEFDFSGLDRVIELLHGAGIRVNLATGTASPPPWLAHAHPEMLPVAEDGTRRYPGGRQAFCPSSPVYRDAALRLVEKVASRYGAHPAVALWHVSNELGCHNALSHSDASTEAFREWLRARYRTIEALNTAWGTAFWSQEYGGFDEILTPRAALSARNPGQALDFHRFSSDALLAHYRAEAEVIRRHSELPITTNFMVAAHIENMDYWQWAPDMDVIANDHYLDHRLGDPRAELSFAADLTRGLAQGEPWMLMEHSTGAVNWQPVNHVKEPGQLARNSLTHVARGADGVCFFQWRASVQGTEKFHSAMLPHAGTDSALWREVVDLGATVGRIGEVAGTRVVADVALVFSWESWWASDAETRPSTAFGYLDQVHAAYAALAAWNVTVDIVAPGAPLDDYRLVVVPGLHVVRESEAAVVSEWVRRGGTVLVTFLSGTVDADDRVYTGGYTGPFRDLLGVFVEEFAPVEVGRPLRLASGGTATLWSERMRATTADVIDTILDGPAAGSPAITRHTWGEGAAWYLSTLPDRDTYAHLAERLVAESGVAPAARLDAARSEVEVVRRRGDDRSYLFVVNHSVEPVRVDADGFDLITQNPVTGSVEVPAGAVRIIREERPS